jgi:hypothetical protein
VTTGSLAGAVGWLGAGLPAWLGTTLGTLTTTGLPWEPTAVGPVDAADAGTDGAAGAMTAVFG